MLPRPEGLGLWPRDLLSYVVFTLSQLPSKALVPEMEEEDEEDDSEDAINEFDFLGSGEDGEGSPDPRRCAADGNPHELGERAVPRLTTAGLACLSFSSAHSHVQLLPVGGSPPDGHASSGWRAEELTGHKPWATGS